MSINGYLDFPGGLKKSDDNIIFEKYLIAMKDH